MRVLLPLAVVLLSAAPAMAARRPSKPPAPPRDAVTDRDVTRLLADHYGTTMRLHGRWKTDGLTRELCADSGARRGPRHVAVCTRGDGDTRVDLYVFAPAPATLLAAFHDIPAPGAATVGFVDLGPARPAFVVTSTPRDGAVQRTVRAVFAEEEGRVRRVLQVVTGLRDAGTCTPGSTPLGRRCARRLVDLTCTLRFDSTRVQGGRYAAELQVTGDRGGDRVARTIPLPHDAYGYRVSARVLDAHACGRPD